MKSIKLLALCLLASGALNAAQAASLSLSPSAQNVTLGNSLSFDVLFNPEGSTAALGAFDFNLTYDASLFGFSGSSFGKGLDVFGLGSIQNLTPSSGALNFFELSLDSAADLLANQSMTSFKLATLSFTPQGTGNARFGLTVNALADAAGDSLVASATGALVNVTAVPEPSSYAMLLAGLGMLALAKRRRV